MKLLVTGGAGYIGSHVVRQLAGQGHEVVVVDDLSTGRREAVLGARLVVCNLADTATLERLFAAERFEAVLHFAAAIVVPESVGEPLKYYGNNTRNTLGLLELMARHGVEQLVFSSTAAVYAASPEGRVSEESPLGPESPYGASKLMSERMVLDCARASRLRAVILRYFNVAGADPQARIGQATPRATHLIKVACEVVAGARPHLELYGTDYPTRDGTCVRDYIHVEDLASAHLAALAHLAGGGATEILNCGYGTGFSVREVIAAVERVAGAPLKVVAAPRRPGDAVRLVAQSDRIRSVLGWQPAYADLDTIVRHALAWERKWQGMR